MLRAVPIRAPEQVEQLRRLRNLTRHGYSGFNGMISESDQAAWWSLHATALAIRAWLYEDDRGRVVGFGLIRKAEGKWWTVVGVDPAHAGQGYGGWITHDLVERSPEPPWATARRDNPVAIRLHREVDWDEIDGPDPALRYFHARRIWPGAAAIEHWAEHGWSVCP